MTPGRLFLIAGLVGTLGVLGCGDDGGGTAGTGGSGGTGGTGGTGGNGALSTCDAVCSGTCNVGDPNDPNCESNCAAFEPSYATDNCGGFMQDFLECAEPGCMIDDAYRCVDNFNQWDACAGGTGTGGSGGTGGTGGTGGSTGMNCDANGDADPNDICAGCAQGPAFNDCRNDVFLCNTLSETEQECEECLAADWPGC